jgi:hypothetical protein
VQLNNGDRWQANPETTDGIKFMQAHMEAFSNSDSLDDFAILSDSLKVEFQMIFQKCSMEGEAHEQLHNYLLPMLGKFKKLASEDSTISQSTFEDIKAYLKTYELYFK